MSRHYVVLYTAIIKENEFMGPYLPSFQGLTFNTVTHTNYLYSSQTEPLILASISRTLSCLIPESYHSLSLGYPNVHIS